MKKVFLDSLPRKGGSVDWKNSVGSKVKFIYDNIEGEVEIVDYGINKSGYLTLRYKNKKIDMTPDNFKKCSIGTILGSIHGKMRVFKVLKGYNDMHTTNPELGKLLWNHDDGYRYTAQSNQRVDFKCPRCQDKIKNKIIANIYLHGLSCSKCSDGISYPEKFIYNFLYQLNIYFEYQEIFEWSKNYVHSNKKLCGIKKYDFYIPSFNAIIEIHGIQHYEKRSLRGIAQRTLKEEQENDTIKENLAKDNKIRHYVILDARLSEMEYIKNNILKSNLNNLLDLDGIDWLKCHENACNSLVKIACDLWSKGFRSLKEIREITKLSIGTIRTYLKQGNVIGWCDYDPKIERTNNGIKNGKKNTKAVVRLSLNGEYIDEFISFADVNRKLKIPSSSLHNACNGKQELAGGFKWRYKEDQEEVPLAN